MSLETLGTVIVVAGTIPATLFPIVYAFSRWYVTRIGRALMIKAVGLMLLIDLAVIRWVFGELPFYSYLRIGVFGLVIFGVYYQFIALVITRLQARRDRRRSWPDVPERNDQL